MTTTHAWDVIVIGGGLAGLVAARDTTQAGLRTIVLEARPRLGGRTWTRTFKGRAEQIELGGTWVTPRWQPHVAKAVQRYSLQLQPRTGPGVSVSLVTGRLVGGSLPVDPENRSSWHDAIRQLLAHSMRLSPSQPMIDPPEDLDIAFSSLVERMGVSEQVHEGLDAIAVNMFGCMPDRLSAISMLAWLRSCDGDSAAFDFAEEFQFRSGTGSLVQALADDTSAEIRCGVQVAGVHRFGQVMHVVTTAGEMFTAKAAIVSVPVNVWRDIHFSPPLHVAKQTLAADGHAGHASKVWAVVRNVEPRFFASGFRADLAWLGAQEELTDGSLMVGFGAGPGWLNIFDREQVETAIRTYAPNAAVVAIDGHDWSTDPFSRGTWMAWRPGQPTALQAGVRQVEGRLIFAGSDLAPRWPGWMEGALMSGSIAAQQAMQLCRDPIRT